MGLLLICRAIEQQDTLSKRNTSSVASETVWWGFCLPSQSGEIALQNPSCHRTRGFCLRRIDHPAEQQRFCSKTARVLPKSELLAPQTPNSQRKTRFALENQDHSTDGVPFHTENGAFRWNTGLSVSKSRRFGAFAAPSSIYLSFNLNSATP